MMRFFRKHRNSLMIVIAVLAIPFVFYFNKSGLRQPGPTDIGQVFDRKISLVEAQKIARLYGLAVALGMSDFVQDLSAGGRTDDQRAQLFVLNLLILRHESEHLGIEPTPSEIADYVRTLPAFHGSSGFDLKKYTEFVQETLSPHGFSEAQLEDLARDQLSLDRVKELVAAGVAVPATEIKETYDQGYGLTTASVIRLKTTDFSNDVKVTDDDVRKYFESRKAEFKTDEKRKVELVTLSLNDQEKKLTGRERVDALQKLADRATDFTQALLEKDANFEKVSAKFQLPVQTTGEFTSANPDPKLKGDSPLGPAAFQLTSQDPNSEPIQVADGYCILHLSGISPSRPLTLEEAKPKIVDTIKASRAREELTNRGMQDARELREALKAGQPLNLAAQKLNVKVEKVPPFILMDKDQANESAADKKDADSDMLAIKNAAASLQPGEVSEFFPWESGGVIVVLEKRDFPDESKYGSKKKELAERIERNKREIVFYEWLQEKQREGIMLSGPPAGKEKGS